MLISLSLKSLKKLLAMKSKSENVNSFMKTGCYYLKSFQKYFTNSFCKIIHHRYMTGSSVDLFFWHFFLTGMTPCLSKYSIKIYNKEWGKIRCFFILHAAPKKSFTFRVFLVNVTKSTVSCGFGHIY